MSLRDEIISELQAYHLKIFPLRDKRPTQKDWKNMDEFVPDGTPFGVQLGGESSVFVIDVDDDSLMPYFTQFFEKTYCVKTGRGFHIYVLAETLPPSNRQFRNEKGQGIDLKTSRGYVVGETSEHYTKEGESYVKSGKKYEILSKARKINPIDFETELKPILDELEFELTKEPIKKRLGNAMVNGVPEGNRNNELFALACDCLKSVSNPTLVYDHIAQINERSDKPLSKEEIDKIIQQATATVQRDIEENNSKFTEEKGRIEYEILEKEPEKLRAITLDKDGNAFILVYLFTKRTENGLVNNDHHYGYFVTNGLEGKKIIKIDDSMLVEKYSVSKLFDEFETLAGRWKYSDIQEYLASNEKVNPKELFDSIHKLERKHFENQYDSDYYFQVCWISHTYFYPLFDYTPYNDLVGMKATGKTKRLDFLSMLSYNGMMSGDSTLSSVFRTIQGTGATLLLDETENLQGGKDDRTDFENLLRNGFQRNGKVTRSRETTKKDFVPETFSVYSPKAFGHIHGVDNVLADRNISTNLVRTRNKQIANSYPDERKEPEIYQSRESLYRLFLDYGEYVEKLIPEAQSLIHELIGREMKLWLPIVTMALFFEKYGVEKVLDKIKSKMMTTSEDKKISDLEDNDDFKILNILDKTDTIPTYSKELYHHLNDRLGVEFGLEKFSDRQLKESLKRLGMNSKRDGRGIFWTNITPQRIQEAKERVGLVKPTQATLADDDSRNKNHDSVDNVGSVA